jgi:pyridoxine 5-phosphate synthase
MSGAVGGGRIRLGLNVDHVATLRNARGGAYPDPVRAAELALGCGVDGITAHLREDRRHIRDADIAALVALGRRLGRPLNFEMAATPEMVAIAVAQRPHACCLVPEKRTEVTTEGGLDVAGGRTALSPAVRALSDAGARVSLFVDPDPAQVDAASGIGAAVVELHTGAYCDAVRAGETEPAQAELARLVEAAARAASQGLEVHAGHGIDYATVAAIAAIPEVAELNIGHFLIGEAVFVGLPHALGHMRALMDAARAPVRP